MFYPQNYKWSSVKVSRPFHADQVSVDELQDAHQFGYALKRVEVPKYHGETQDMFKLVLEDHEAPKFAELVSRAIKVGDTEFFEQYMNDNDLERVYIDPEMCTIIIERDEQEFDWAVDAKLEGTDLGSMNWDQLMTEVKDNLKY